jgi:hypothetical protein
MKKEKIMADIDFFLRYFQRLGSLSIGAWKLLCISMGYQPMDLMSVLNCMGCVPPKNLLISHN